MRHGVNIWASKHGRQRLNVFKLEGSEVWRHLRRSCLTSVYSVEKGCIGDFEALLDNQARTQQRHQRVGSQMKLHKDTNSSSGYDGWMETLNSARRVKESRWPVLMVVRRLVHRRLRCPAPDLQAHQI